MLNAIRFILFAAVLSFPGIASAALWADSGTYSPFSDGETYAVLGSDVGSLAPGTYEFSITYTTLGTWDSESDPEDSMILSAFSDGYSKYFAEAASDMSFSNTYTKTLIFTLTSVLNGIFVQSDVTGIDEKWEFVSASINATPVPGAFWLLGSGLLGLIGLRRRLI
ncbi:hypothetical protein [Pseudodesulfovibrio piezophilus]|uniref:PEP-CTERM protein-sorting domain-containing protein n=1 Tax=Pseudodesulfovibrio piezophilus (strain DSM 21447 / JCM 15486 / C1TLV30) TaxID=1322246 RepID=M1WY45_PSEP2|nr:hypothetical protein [Pseudodesulfovibrio piezophilus]CCH50118.1 exported protein of unknown function [Pseudodesulfovibrio piezophilus C1TLV30]